MQSELDRATWWRCDVSRSKPMALLSCLPLIISAGCGDRLSTVTGTVTLDGKPVACSKEIHGTVNFYRTDGGGAPGVGWVDESGHYRLKTGANNGIEPGSYLVAIAIRKITMPTDGIGMPKGTEIAPSKYTNIQTSGLTAEVNPGGNTIDFPLTSDH